MATGMEMMLKSMGFDPEKIKTTLIEAKNEIMAQVESVNTKLARIESKLDALNAPETGQPASVQNTPQIGAIENAGSDDTTRAN
jgi:hypothetical protein